MPILIQIQILQALGVLKSVLNLVLVLWWGDDQDQAEVLEVDVKVLDGDDLSWSVGL